MPQQSSFGYAGHLLRVDLGQKKIEKTPIDRDFAEEFIGGTGFGAKVLYDEVPAGVGWSDPENRVVISSGPLGGSRMSGSGTFSVVSKGPLTDHAGTSQANGFFGAFLKFSGFDGIILQGRADNPCHLVIHDGAAEIQDAGHLWGLDTWETENRIRKEGEFKNRISVFCIGPAAEKGVRFAVLAGDHGHVTSKNGLGAVLASKNLKAIVVVQGRNKVPVHNPELLKRLAADLLHKAKTDKGGIIDQFGTAGLIRGLSMGGMLPIKNYTTNLFPSYEKVTGQTLHQTMELKRKPCWACGLGHLHYVKVLDGPYAGLEAEEPEYECVASFGPLIGQEDLGAVVMLSDLVDRLGMDANETGWLIAWVMECYEKGIFTKGDTDGLEMNWGNAEAAGRLVEKIARREGIGDLLAEGVMRAAEQIGGEVKECAIYTKKGATPRTHDHRARWAEMLDTCLSTTSTLEAQAMGGPLPELYGYPPLKDRFDPIEVASANALVNGYRVFEDCLGICNFNTPDPQLTLECVNAITGWNLDLKRAIWLGARMVHMLRMFNLRHGQNISLEAPSTRYGSKIMDGPCEGKDVSPHWNEMRQTYYKGMGWDTETGWPLPETLRKFELEHLIRDLPKKP